MDEVTFSVFRGEPDDDGEPFGRMVDYTVALDEGMVVLDEYIESKPSRPLICRAAGTAKQGSAARAVLRSTANQN